MFKVILRSCKRSPDFLPIIFAELWTLFVRDIFVEWPSVSLNTCRPAMMNEASSRTFQPIRGERRGVMANQKPRTDASYRWRVCRVMSGPAPALPVINYGDPVGKPIWNVSEAIGEIISIWSWHRIHHFICCEMWMISSPTLKRMRIKIY